MYFRKKYAVMIDLHIHLARLPNKKQLTQLLLDKNYDFIAIACEPWEWEEVTLLRKLRTLTRMATSSSMTTVT